MDNRHSKPKPAIIKAGTRKTNKPKKRNVESGKVQTKITDFVKPKNDPPKKQYKAVDLNKSTFVEKDRSFFLGEDKKGMSDVCYE